MQSIRPSDAPLVDPPKSSQGVSLYSRLFNRPFGKVLARLAHRLGLSANQVTTISAVLTYAAIAVVALVRPSAVLGVVVAVLLILGFAMDSADGQVARLAGKSTIAGEWFDHVVDAGKMVAIHAAVLIGWYRFDVHRGGWLLLPLGFQSVAVVTFSGLTTVSLLKRMHPGVLPPPAPSLARAVGLLPADYGVLCLTFALWGHNGAFTVVYLVLFFLNAAILVGFLVRWFAELTALDQLIASRRGGDEPPAPA